MFEHLLESKATGPRSWRQGLVAVVVHGGLLVAAIEATQSVAATVVRPRVDTRMVYTAMPSPAAPAAASPVGRPNAAVAPSALPAHLPKLVIPTDIPHDLPPIDIGPVSLDPTSYADVGRGIGSGIGSGSGAGGGTGSGGSGIGNGRDGIYTGDQLDHPVQSVFTPKLRYPIALERLGVEGRVNLQYVVDTTGRVEPGTFQVMGEARPEFIDAAKEAALKSVFKPAKLRGHRVQQRVVQTFRFQVR